MGCLEIFCAIDKVKKQWIVKDKLVEEIYDDVAEWRDVDSGDDILQVLAVALEVKPGESGEDNACVERRTSTFSVGPRSRRSEFEVE